MDTLTDRQQAGVSWLVDGLVNLMAWIAGEGSYALRRIQTGLVQNYALMMIAGVFVLLTVYLLVG